jgi:predicted RNA-binding Zn ribbon-like protein
VAKGNDQSQPADQVLLAAVANTGHEDVDELGDVAAMQAWWSALGGTFSTATPDDSESLGALRALRSVIRRLAWRNNGVQLDPDPVADAAFATLTLHPDLTGGRISLRAAHPHGTAATICAATVAALIRAASGPGWSRFKACRAADCGWVFLDASRNTSRRWCDMGDCGNRAKGAAFRARMRDRAEPAGRRPTTR